MVMAENDGKLLEAQAALIGSLLIQPEIAGAFFGTVPAEDFTIPVYRHLYDAALTLFQNGTPIDAVILASRAGQDYKQTIIDCVSVTATAANWKAYAALLRDEATAFRLRQIGVDLAGCKNSADGEALIRQAAALFDRRQRKRSLSLYDALGDFAERQRNREKTRYLKTGIPKLDAKSYIEPGDYIVLGGYPSAGKSALAIQIALTLCKSGRVGFFSLETNLRKLTDRAAACYLDLPFDFIKEKIFGDASAKKAQAFRETIKDGKLPLYFLEAAGMTVDELTATALSMRLDVVIIDYLQILRSARQSRSRYDEITEISMALHQFSQRHGITVIALSQLSRPTTPKTGKAAHPTMRDLRESGQIEQDADLILLLYQPDSKPNSASRYLDIAKNKEGQVGRIYLSFAGVKQRFSQTEAPDEDIDADMPEEWK